MKKTTYLLMTILLLVLATLSVQAQVPPVPEPPVLVNDFAGILGDTQAMEDSLENIAMHTSNQICVVTMSDLGGMTPAQMAQSIGNQWGVGSSKYNNGVVILIKPKTQDSNGQTYIALGTGLEDVISDSVSARIVAEYMIPHFKNNDYPGGAWAGINEIYKLAVQKYNEPQDSGKESLGLIGILGLILGGVLIACGAYAIYRWRKRKKWQGFGGGQFSGKSGGGGTW